MLEYACPAWHTGLTCDQYDRLETVQKRALSIMFNMSVFENYLEFCYSNGIEKHQLFEEITCVKGFLSDALSMKIVVYIIYCLLAKVILLRIKSTEI